MGVVSMIPGISAGGLSSPHSANVCWFPISWHILLSLCFLHVGNPMPSPLGDGWTSKPFGAFWFAMRLAEGFSWLPGWWRPSLSEISPIRIVALNTHGNGGMLGRFLVLSAAEGIGRMGACAHTAVGGEIWSLQLPNGNSEGMLGYLLYNYLKWKYGYLTHVRGAQ